MNRRRDKKKMIKQVEEAIRIILNHSQNENYKFPYRILLFPKVIKGRVTRKTGVTWKHKNPKEINGIFVGC